MKTQVKLKSGISIPQPMTKHDWQFGYIDGYCRAADDRCYAIVVTEHDEFEFVMLNWIEKCNWM